VWNNQVDIFEDLDFWTRRINETDVLEFEVSGDLFWPVAFFGVNVDRGNTVDGFVNLGASTQGKSESLKIGCDFCDRKGSNQDGKEDAACQIRMVCGSRT
jgi:hypothetical protein